MAEPRRTVSIPKVSIPSGLVGPLKWVMLAAGASVLLLIASSALTIYVRPNEFAVRQVLVGPDQGNEDAVYGPGLHFVVPGYERYHVFPRDLQVLEFNDETMQGSSEAAHAPSINIQTSEGYRVVVDVTIAYRIVNPYEVLTRVGPGRLYETSLVRPRADPVLRQKLGELGAEQFYEGALRRQKALEARDLLAAELAASGIQIWSVMVRHYRYDERYQEAIEQRKIQDQMVFKNRAEAAAAVEEAEKNRVLAEGRAIVDVETERGMAEVVKIRADYELYSRKRGAEGDLLVELARAESKRLENDALSTAGASNVVGLKMADALGNTQVIIVPTDGPSGVNPLDLDRLIQGW
ncbi:MAG: SPFH domain-containing protein [Pseudomonadota bacterium]|nr:SPFH domain-containing protein [Pseudomonadota bacterium]